MWPMETIMSSDMQEAEAALVEHIEDFGTSVTLVSPDATETTLQALIGSARTDETSTGNREPATSMRTTDFQVITANLPDEVTRSHRLQFGDQMFQPISQNGEPCFRTTPFGLITRIHTHRL